MSTVIIVSALAFLIIVTLLIIMLFTVRKRARGITWFPDGFFQSTSKANGSHDRPDGQDMSSQPVQKLTASGQELDPNRNACSHWSDEDESNERQNKGIKRETDSPENPCLGTQTHMNAASSGKIPNPSIAALTPPHIDDLFEKNIDAKGEGGMTPLMFASLGPGIESESRSSCNSSGVDDSSVGPITDLIRKGASLESRTDHTGETSLHLAARYARSDVAKCLLDAGADPNAQDNSGRTPLHSAVAADAQGVFHILRAHPDTNLNAKMVDGTTPLIIAARLAIEGLVEELVNANVIVNLADERGKTALHWAAAVNNCNAMLVLLKNRAYRDMQDNKGETPLFLAAQEGHFQAVKLLLDHFANRDPTDDMGRRPQDIAQERLYQDIVSLLETYRGEGLMLKGGFASSQHSVMKPPFMHHPHPHSGRTKKKKAAHKSRTMSPSNKEPWSISPYSKQQVVKLSPLSKKKKSKKALEAAAAGSCRTDSTSTDSHEGVLEPSSYESAISGGHMALSQPNVNSSDDLYSHPHHQQPPQQHPQQPLLLQQSSYRYDRETHIGIEHIKVEKLSAENIFQLIKSLEFDTSAPGMTSTSIAIATAAPATITTWLPSQSLSSPSTSGYNTMSPGISASPFSQYHSSPHSIQSPQSGGWGQTASPPVYPLPSGSPADSQAASPPCRHLPLSPTHLQAIHHNVISQQQQQQQQNLHYSWPHFNAGGNGNHSYSYYPTPPSQHIQHTDSTPPPVGLMSTMGALADPQTAYLTPSPNTPEQWSSSWSEGISSPPQSRVAPMFNNISGNYPHRKA